MAAQLPNSFFTQRSPRSPDFRHKRTNEVLWIEGWSNSPWVTAELAAMIEGQLQSSNFFIIGMDHGGGARAFNRSQLNEVHLFVGHQTGGSGITSTPFERGPKEGVDKNSTGLCEDVRTLCRAGKLKEALYILNQSGIQADFNSYVCLLQGCTRTKNVAQGKQVHAHIIQSGFKPNVFLLNILINMYAKCGRLVDARQVFDKMPERSLFTWTIMIAGYAKHSRGREALKLYEQMQWERVMPDRIICICLLNVCSSLGALEKGKEVHDAINKAGIVSSIDLETTLADMYAKCGSMKDACQVFNNMAERNVVSWNVMVAGYARNGCGREALEFYEQMQQERVTPNRITFTCVLKACASLRALGKGREVLDDINKSGIVLDIILETAIVDMYAKCGNMKDAHQVFENMAKRNVVSWNTIIAGYAHHGSGRDALEMYEQMGREGVTPDRVTFICVLNACASLGALKMGKEVHADIKKAGIASDVNLETALVDMYAKCGTMKDARHVFKHMAHLDIVSWNAMIAGYSQNGSGREAFEIYYQMQREGVMPNKVTFICFLNACVSLRALDKGKEVHADIIKAGIASTNLETSLVDMYAKCGSIKDARKVFDNMTVRDVVSWNTMIAGYAQHGCGREAIEIYEQMQGEGMTPDTVTFTTVLNACASLGALEKGKEVHADFIKSGCGSDVNLDTALADMYAKCGSMKDACQVFDNMAERNVVSWNAMITGYSQLGCDREALEIYEQMQQEGMTPDIVTYICILNACASLGVLRKGKDVHADIVKVGIVSHMHMETALVDMYAKCGSMKDARQVFGSMDERDVVSWSAMIAGCAQHGHGREAQQLFEQMQQEGLKPNSITFLSLLSACSHAGLVEEGHQYFHSLSQDHGLTPTIKHFGCMVDILGRGGRLDEAENFINRMPIPPDGRVWRPLLGACRMHGDVEIAERTANAILKSDPLHPAAYVLLSDIYAAVGRWEDRAMIRKMMEDRGVRNEQGHSCIEVGNQLHTFLVDDKLHPQIEEIHAELRRLAGQLKVAGYVPDTSFVWHDLEEEQKQLFLWHHSEKLAIAFGLISTPAGMPIHVIKNHRVCGDCHTATKFISKIVGRPVVVRDANRFHHFQDGVCSCADYW